MRWLMLGALAGLGPAAMAFAHPLDTLAPGAWTAAPGSHLEQAFPTPRPYGDPAAVIGAWGGGAFDVRGERLLVWGGGHGDYAGNEVYAFDVAAMKWSRLWGPEPVITQVPPECSSTYAGGTPSARHTYDGIEVIPTTGQMWSTGGFRFCGNASTDAVTWLFDLAAPKWVRGTDALEAVGTPTSAWDPRGQRVLYQAQNLFQAYNPATGQYTRLGEVDGGFWATATSAVDVEHDLFLSVTDGKLRVWNLATKVFTSQQATTGGARAMAGHPGVDWDPNLKRIVTWSGGTSVYSLDVGTWTWFEHAAAPSNTVQPTAPAAAGTYGRFRFMPARNAYVLVNKASEDVFFYKLTSGAGTPVPPVDAGAPDTAGGAAGSGGSAGGGTGGSMGGSAGSGGSAGGATGGAGTTTSGSAGCGCGLGRAPRPASAVPVTLAVLLWLRRRRPG